MNVKLHAVHRVIVASTARRLLVGVIYLVATLAAATTYADNTPYKQGLLWEIVTPGQPVSYLFGTIHSEDSRVVELPAIVNTTLKAADTLVLEAPVDSQTETISFQAMLFTDSTRLPKVLSPELYQRTLKVMVERGFSQQVVNALKPWAISIILSVPKPDTGLFLDLFLMQLANAQSIPVWSLETVGEQLAILDGFSLNEQVQMLKDTLNELPEITALHEQLIRAYLDRDLARLVSISEQSVGMGSVELSEKLSDQVIVQRNKRMVDRMEPMLLKGKVFVAVGALHLPGEEGILSLLVARGHQVKAIY
jgi:uncharacterized protein YbaP (TraB family)